MFFSQSVFDAFEDLLEIDFNKRTQINIDTSQRLFQRYFGFIGQRSSKFAVQLWNSWLN